MPTINISKRNYDNLHRIMAAELKAQISDDPKALLNLVKSKYGITFNDMITKLIKDYNITR